MVVAPILKLWQLLPFVLLDAQHFAGVACVDSRTSHDHTLSRADRADRVAIPCVLGAAH